MPKTKKDERMQENCKKNTQKGVYQCLGAAPKCWQTPTYESIACKKVFSKTFFNFYYKYSTKQNQIFTYTNDIFSCPILFKKILQDENL